MSRSGPTNGPPFFARGPTWFKRVFDILAPIATIAALAVCGHFHAHWLTTVTLLVLTFWAAFRPSRP